jgi:EPS-associated MarR family transcriptional regulator
MIEQSEKEEILFIIKEIETDPTVSQRAVSHKLGISLGKTNCLLRQIIKKGFIKVKNFADNPGKLKRIQYLLTEKGLEEKFRLLHYFLLKKESEYNNLKQEWEQLERRIYGKSTISAGR